MAKEDQYEIDLVELLLKISRTIRKNLLLITLCTSLGLGVSIVIFYLTPKVYESRMTILTESYAESLTSSINTLIKDGNYNLLSERLGLSDDDAKKLVKVEIEGEPQSNTNSVDESKRIFIVVSVKVMDNAILPKIEKGIIQFINENEFVKVRVEQNKKFYQELIKKVDQEIAKIEILKEKIGQGTFNEGRMVLIEPSNPYSKTIELFKERLQYQKLLELANSAQVVEGFIPLQRPVRPKLALTLVEGFLFGLFLSFGIIFIRYIANSGSSK